MFVIVYLDDILVYSLTEAEHTEHVILVLEALRAHGLFTKLEKCSFSQTQVEYLRYIISDQGVSMDPERVKTIMEWPSPATVKETLSFLGFCNFY